MYEDKIENDLIIITKQTMEMFLKLKEPSETLALYCFYYYTGKWQKTNQPKATNKYVKKGLKWGEDKVKRILDQLIECGLVEKIVKRDDTGKIKGWYIKLNYIFKQDTINQLNQNRQMPDVAEARCGSQDTNALSDSNINALSENNINASNSEELQKDINNCLSLFGTVNTTNLYKNTTERKRMGELLETKPRNKLNYILKNLDTLSQDKFFPLITKPSELLNKWDKAVLYLTRSAKEPVRRPNIKIK